MFHPLQLNFVVEIVDYWGRGVLKIKNDNAFKIKSINLICQTIDL